MTSAIFSLLPEANFLQANSQKVNLQENVEPPVFHTCACLSNNLKSRVAMQKEQVIRWQLSKTITNIAALQHLCHWEEKISVQANFSLEQPQCVLKKFRALWNLFTSKTRTQLLSVCLSVCLSLSSHTHIHTCAGAKWLTKVTTGTAAKGVNLCRTPNNSRTGNKENTTKQKLPEK